MKDKQNGVLFISGGQTYDVKHNDHYELNSEGEGLSKQPIIQSRTTNEIQKVKNVE